MSILYKLESDDHDNPAFVKTDGGGILAMYTRHSLRDLFINTLHVFGGEIMAGEPQLIHPIGQEELSNYPRETITYANLIQLENEYNRIYCFGRSYRSHD